MVAVTKNRVLNYIWQNSGTHRKQIATRFNIHPNLVSDAVKELIEEKWIVEKKSENAAVGRTPLELYLNAGRSALVVSYSYKTMTCGLINADGEVLQTNEVAHDLKQPEEIAALAARQTAKLQAKHAGIIIGISVADPGMIDYQNGEVIRSSSFPAWRKVRIAELFRAGTGQPVMVMDTTHACAAAQYRALSGCRRDRDAMLYIDYSEGRVGMTLVTPRGIWRGSGLAGEVGHVVLDPKGALCDCGTRGCLESEAGARALERKATALLAKDVHSVLRDKAPPGAADIFKAARAGDRFARTVVHDVVQNLCFSAAVVVAMLHPRFVVIGAENADAIAVLAGEIRQTLNTRLPAEIAATAEVSEGRPTATLGLIGAGLMLFAKAIQGETN